MKNLYLKIIETLENGKDKFLHRGLEPIETIDLYDGQPEHPEDFEFTCPALFIDYRIDWERGGVEIKKGVVSLDIHVVTHPGPGTESFSSALPDALKILDYYDVITSLMENVETENVSSLALISEEPIQTEYFCYHILRFSTVITRGKERRCIKLKDINLNINIPK